MQRDLDDILINVREKLALGDANKPGNGRQLLGQRLAYCLVFLAFYLSRFTGPIPVAMKPDFNVNFLILKFALRFLH